jgi:hypothetical protein
MELTWMSDQAVCTREKCSCGCWKFKIFKFKDPLELTCDSWTETYLHGRLQL